MAVAREMTSDATVEQNRGRACNRLLASDRTTRMSSSRRARQRGRSRLPIPCEEPTAIDTAGVLGEVLEWPFELSLDAKTLIALAGSSLLAALLAFHMLGARGIFSPAEARYALIAQGMAESGDWIQPRLNHVRYDEKPPLLYWAIAASYHFLGQSDFASRVPSAVAYVGTAAITFGIAYELLGPSAAPLAALVYITSVGTFLFGRFVFTDTLLIFCTTLSLYGLCRIARSRPGHGPALTFYLGMALAGLTKGLIGLLFPLATAVTYWLLCEERGFWRKLRPFFGAAVLALMFLPWHVVLALRDPAFLDFYVMNEHVRRFFNAREPIDYVSLSIAGFWISTFFWLLPWALFLPGALRNAVANDSRRLAIPLIWAAWVGGFFTLTQSRLEYYALPAAPALAVIVAAYWECVFRSGAHDREVQLAALVLFAAALAAVPKLFLFPRSGIDLLMALVSNVDGYYRQYFVAHPGESLAFAREALHLARPFAMLLGLIGGGVWLLVGTERRRLAFALLVAGFVPCLALVDLGMRSVAADRSQRAFGRVVEENWSEDARLVVVGNYEDLCGITYYTHRPTEMLEAEPQDLLWGFRRGDARELFLTAEKLQGEWNSSQRVFVVSDKSFDLPGATVLAESPRGVLRTNHPLQVAMTGSPSQSSNSVSIHE
jgi:4-amino-4-deoxy-L-arabinose transferase-like glycosyltransferase